MGCWCIVMFIWMMWWCIPVSGPATSEDSVLRLAEASLNLNLTKCEFVKATVTYFGKPVGHGQVRPVDAKLRAVIIILF